MTGPPPPEVASARALWGALGGPLAAFAYALLRLVDRLSEPPPEVVRKMAHVPYFWRLGLSVWLGLSAALLLGLLLPPGARGWLLHRGAALPVGLGAFAVLVVLLVP